MYAFLVTLLLFAVFGACIFLLVLWHQERTEMRAAVAAREAAERRLNEIANVNRGLSERNKRLERWAAVEDAAVYAAELRRSADEQRQKAEEGARLLRSSAADEAKQITKEARAKVRESNEAAGNIVRGASDRAAQIIQAAEKQAQEIAGKAYDAVKHADLYEQVVTAMRNKIDGYGDRYLVPAENLLDDLAEEFSHKDAGQKLKLARDHTKAVIGSGNAATCDYVEQERRRRAIQFTIDAFNGKVDSILTRVKHDNVGTLEQEIRDAYVAVNYGGKAFRNARITEGYLNSRIHELHWASIVQELKLQQQEEQRRIREQIREEQRARREYEKAIKDAQKEERIIRQAIAKAEAQAAVATEAQREEFEKQLQELAAKLQEAEDRNLRAVSMAQQTRRGYVYVISNIGSFGEHVYKIGLTRRLEPLDRVRELGDSSVPFSFDVHALIFSEDAPALEHRLHKHFVRSQVNKVNHRKEFFRTELAEIRQEIEQMGIDVHWTLAAEAADYRETQAIERRIAEDPTAFDAWANRQLVLELEDEVESDEEELVAVG